jgi:cardiolipin synthase (CMP-forming)
VRWLPHFLTLLRLAASPILVWLLWELEFRTALLVVGLAAATDWFDGYVARKLHATGQLGSILDPLADKILLVTVFVMLGVVGLVPLWILCLAIGRDVVVTGGALLLRIYRNRRKFVPSTVGKVSTFFQMVFVLLALVYAAFPLAPFLWLKFTALLLCAIFTGWSGLEYVRLGIQMTRAPALPETGSGTLE